MASSLGPGRPSTACYQCKQQKVRCSGDNPCCRRCSRMNAACIYPNGPSTRRRSLSRLDTNYGPPTGRAQSNHERMPVNHHTTITEKDNEPLMNGNNNPTNPLNAFGLPDQLGIPESLLSDLIDTYFSHQYNARLLLHKETLQTQRHKGTVRLHVLLSVCAIGANFCRDANKAWSLKDFAYLWAERAGKLVLNEVENPNEDNVVTFANLALFWYMQGAWRRSYMHKGNAMQTVHVLNLLSNANKGKTPLDEEMSRRRYWACYLINCHASNSMFAISPPEKLATFPLPWREADFESGTSEYPPVLFGSTSTNGAIYSELIRAMTHWSSVDSLMKASEATHQTRLATIHQHDAEIRKWWEDFPPDLKLTESNILTFRRVDLTKLLLIHVVYFQCLCVLHASIVPLFTWGQEESPNTVALQMSAQIAYENACRTSELLAVVWERDHDVSDYTSFVAYAAYCSYAIQIPFQWCLDAAVRERAQRNTALNLQILQATSQYWRFNWLLACYAQYLGKIHFHSQLGLEGEPKNVNPEKLNTFRLGASRARVSLLSLNGILWKDDGCSVQGEEVTDLGIDADRVSSSPQQQPVASWISEQSAMPNRPEGESFGNEDSSVTTLYDGSAAGLRRTGLSDQLLSGFFQPLLQPSHMLDTVPGGFGVMNMDNMSFNMDDVWGTSRTGGVP